MSRIQRVYVDNSVYGGYFDKEFSDWTEKFFKEVDEGRFLILYSRLIEKELRDAPKRVKDFSKPYLENSEIVRITRDTVLLAEAYLKFKVVGESSYEDCIHVASATIAKADVIVSWNFKHIVRLDKIEGYNTVNRKLGYSVLEIRSPREVLHYE
ncbi:type II toxin-antitoxin system VapC family toxin [Leptospira noguchii]|uniref:type II toxin-antitoxin system VapC family toxin n=1 Tax=Leptospira noguchii TaxID=28182 RepID=UPI0011474418|nr:type II toxin-antitoxin system VapC family toxin [Leptospira noguchii]TQE65265.1 type II toxin-antitoxin system VapC family toxin [Leptospira noguchii]UOG51103.1 PIN domain protein [Leptospira noguchii]